MEPEETVLVGPNGDPLKSDVDETPAPEEAVAEETEAVVVEKPARKPRLRKTKKKEDEAPRIVLPWTVGKWNGRENYSCLGCSFKTLSVDAMSVHVLECKKLKGGRK